MKVSVKISELENKISSDFNAEETAMMKRMKEYQSQGKTLITNMKPSVFKQKLPNLYKVIDKGLLKFTGAVKLVNKVANSKLQDYRKALELLSQLEKLDGMQDEYSEKIQNAYDNPNAAKSALEKLIKSISKDIEKKQKKASQPSYEEWLKEKKQLQDEVDKTSEALNKITGKSGGLTPDSIKNTSEYKKAKKDYNEAFEKLRNFNGKSPAEYMKRKRKAGKDDIIKDVMGLSSGTLATLSKKNEYAYLHKLHQKFIQFVVGALESDSKAYKDWKDAWKYFKDSYDLETLKVK
jgi:tetratricopeptide (TPR) repeat protein